MNFKISYSKIANKFFFISTLSGWHWSLKKEYKKIWLSKLGSLSKKEKDALCNFADIAKHYGFNKEDKLSWLGAPFLEDQSEEEVWNKVRSWVKKEEYKQLKEIFELFSEKFNQICEEEKGKLKEARKKLSLRLNSSTLQNAVKDFEIFYDHKLPKDKTLNVYLLQCPKESHKVGGGAIMGKQGITLEIRKASEEEMKGYLLTVLHELAHVFFEKEKFSLIKKVTTIKQLSGDILPDQPQESIVNELILRSLSPNLFGEKYFNISKTFSSSLQKTRPETWDELAIKISAKLKPLARRYIKNNQELDANFVNRTIQLINNLCED